MYIYQPRSWQRGLTHINFSKGNNAHIQDIRVSAYVSNILVHIPLIVPDNSIETTPVVPYEHVAKVKIESEQSTTETESEIQSSATETASEHVSPRIRNTDRDIWNREYG